MTYTYVLMDVSPATYEEVKEKLEAAGYQHAIHKYENEPRPFLDMHGIALRFTPQPAPQWDPQWVSAVEQLLKAVDQLMPGLANISIQDYANVNDAPIFARKLLERAKRQDGAR